jgi:hypothetical protein
VGQAGVQLGVGDPLQLPADGLRRPQRGQAALGLAAVGGDVQLDEALQPVAGLGRQGALFEQHLAQRLGLLEHPGVHGSDEGVAADEVHL